MRRPVFNFLLVCATTALCAIVFMQTTFDYLDRPMVYKSYHTKRCVKVETAPTQKPMTCADVNNGGLHYETIWVK
jgi:hypothetical protein